MKLSEKFGMTGWPFVWGATESEIHEFYPCDAEVSGPRLEPHRAISIAAPPAEVFRWLCQMKVAPYSYDLLNNLGRRSPRTLTPGAEQLQLGQRFITAFNLISFLINEHLTLRVNLLGRLMFGELLMSYVVREIDSGSTRLLVKLSLPRPRGLGWVRHYLTGWLDFFMMRKQLMNIRDLAEGRPTSIGSRDTDQRRQVS